MRILQLIPYFTNAFGGPVGHLKMLARELAQLEHQTAIYTTNLADKRGRVVGPLHYQSHVRAFPVALMVGDYFYTPGMKSALKKEEFDVIHAHCYRNYQADLAAWISRKTGKPLVFTAHGTLPKLPRLRDIMLKGLYDAASRGKVLRASKKVIALSLQESKQYHSLGVPKTRIVTVYHGIDGSLFRPMDNGHAVREELGVGTGPVILYAGRIDRRKGLQFLLPAFKQTLTEFPSAKLVICGPDYGYRKALMSLIRSASLADRVILTGKVEDAIMPHLYNASDIVVLPAQYEVFGQVLAEAASCGRAIIATRWGWSAEFFENGEDCMFLEEYGDVAALSRTLGTLLRNPELRARLGARARRKVLRNLSWKTCALEHLRVYEEVLAE